MQVRVFDSIAEIDPADWQALGHQNNPFVQHAFLLALEQGDCLREFGWQCAIVGLYEGETLIAAAPSYVKYNSFGEFVFDWSWAEAYEKNGLPYYPKLVVASPYTPATGPRLLMHPDYHSQATVAQLLGVLRSIVEQNTLSGLHILFCTDEEKDFLADEGLAIRQHYQYHWHNQDYDTEEDFLDQLSSRKRKKIRRERNRVDEQGLSHESLLGGEMSDEQWAQAHRLYALIYDRKWGVPALSLAFFKQLARTMPESIVVNFAYSQEREDPIACAILFQGGGKLYGRYWGCDQQWHSLHFETCYYQGIDWAIDHELNCFEPGAQGEHKIARGFLPTDTYSAHWMSEPQFDQAIHRFTRQEAPHIDAQKRQLNALSPYRQPDPSDDDHSDTRDQVLTQPSSPDTLRS